MRSFIDIFPFLAVSGGAFWLWLRERLKELRNSDGGWYAVCLVFFVSAAAACCFLNVAFLKGMQEGTVSETFATWWQLQQALRQVFLF